MAPLCCIPQDVVHCNIPDILDSKSAVQVLCSNSLCWQSGLVHPGCFYKWEDQLVRFLTSRERAGSSTDTEVMNSLWTKQMWDLPLPSNLTVCKCGEGSLKRKFEDDELQVSKEVKASLLDVIVKPASSGDVKPRELKGECIDEIPSPNESLEDNWEKVTRSKSKKKNKVSEMNTMKKEKLCPFLSFPNPQSLAPSPKRGPDSSLSETTYAPQLRPRAPAEGKRDNSGLIHCCSCQTVHPSLPDFIQHCKTRQHCKLQEKSATGGVAKDDNNVDDDDFDIRREMEQIKGCLLELMKQGLEQDRLAAEKNDEMRESFKFELKRNSGALSMLVEKLKEIDAKVLEIDGNISSCSLKVENNEKDLDSCFDCYQDLCVKMAQLDKDFKALQKKDLIEHDIFKVKISELQGDFSRFKKRLHDVNHAKPPNVESLSRLPFLEILFACPFLLLLAGVAIFVLFGLLFG